MYMQSFKKSYGKIQFQWKYLNKCIILNSVFLIHIVIILASVYATLLGVTFLMSSTEAAMNSLHECDIFEKAIQLSVIVHDDNNESFSIKNCRSRYEKFVYFGRHTRARAVRVREREPSRIPERKITSILHKSRTVRRLLRTYIKKNVRRSSRMHVFINKGRAHVKSKVDRKEKRKYPAFAIKRIKYNQCFITQKNASKV